MLKVVYLLDSLSSLTHQSFRHQENRYFIVLPLIEIAILCRVKALSLHGLRDKQLSISM